jgi:arylsulfatase A-like enzyme
MSPRAVVVALLVLALAGCRAAPPSAPADRVVLISIDTLRADHLGAYGYPRPTSPKLDAFAAGGVIFTDVTSPSPWTLPAHASLFTGLYPGRHGLASSSAKLPATVTTLAQHLAARGFQTAGVVNSNYLSQVFGLERGFQRFRHVQESVAQREPGREITEQAIAWAEAMRGQRAFLFVHYYDVHSDYRSLPEYERQFVGSYAGSVNGTTAQLLDARRRGIRFDEADVGHLVDLYDAGIRQMDDELARLLAALGDDGRTLVIVTSDHGEEFLEHGGVLHGRTQYQELVRVPLIVRGPGVPSGVRVERTVSLVDVMPTILAAVGEPVPAGLDGSDLAPSWRGAGGELDARYLSCEADHNNAEPDVMRAVRHRRHTLHVDRLSGKVALFDLGSDPHEQKDVAGAHGAIATELREQLERYRAARVETGGAVTLTPEQEERLRSLGYVR